MFNQLATEKPCLKLFYIKNERKWKLIVFNIQSRTGKKKMEKNTITN